MKRDRHKICTILWDNDGSSRLSCGCIELDKQTRSVGTTLAGGEVTTHATFGLKGINPA